MGRLLEALKRLESELPSATATVPIILPECPTVAAPDSSRTVDMEPPAAWCEDYPTVENIAADRAPDAVGEEAESRPYAEVTVEFDTLVRLLNEESPFFEVFAPDAAREPAETAIAIAEEVPPESIDRKTDDEPATEAAPFVFWERPEVDDEQHSFFDSRESDFAAESNPLGFGDFALPLPLPSLTHRTSAESSSGEGSCTSSPFSAVVREAKEERGAFGAMARNVLAQLPGEGPAAIFFTSPTDGEGKTETILPLAEALIEESGRRTILVDANLHRPDLTREWRFNSRKGIFDVLAGEADWWEAVQETGIPKLSILLNNGLATRQGIIAQPLAFSELLDNLKREYRLVLIDGASLAHQETIPMVRHCQGVYLVVRLGHSRPRAVREARRVIEQAGGKLLGCIAVGDVLAEV
jgi:Mrp family chromosome partitioning ATPase